MVSKEPWDLYRAVRPLYFVLRLLGMAPVRYVRVDGATGLRVSWVALAYAAILCCALVVGATLYLMWATFEMYHVIQDTKLVLTDALLSMMTYASVLGAIAASALLHRRRAGVLMATVATVDRALVSDRAALYQGTRRRLTLQLSVLVLVMAAYAAYEAYVSDDFDPSDWFFLYFLTVFPVVFTVVLDVQFVLAVDALRVRFCRVTSYFEALLNECRKRNRCADSFLAISSRETTKNTSAENAGVELEGRGSAYEPVVLDEKFIREVFSDVFYEGKSPIANGESSELPQPPGLITLFRAHDALSNSINILTTCFGFQVILEIVRLFMDIVCSVYYSVNNGMHYYVHWLILDVMKIIALATSCHRCTAAASSTAPIVSRLLLEPTAVPTRRLLTLFSQQLLHVCGEIIPCGLMKFNAGMLTQLTGAIATYIVILVQYKTSSPLGADNANTTATSTFAPDNNSSSFLSTED